MAIEISTLKELITEFRALQAKDSVSPDSLGYILDRMVQLIGQAGSDADVEALNNLLGDISAEVQSQANVDGDLAARIDLLREVVIDNKTDIVNNSGSIAALQTEQQEQGAVLTRLKGDFQTLDDEVRQNRDAIADHDTRIQEVENRLDHAEEATLDVKDYVDQTNADITTLSTQTKADLEKIKGEQTSMGLTLGSLETFTIGLAEGFGQLSEQAERRDEKIQSLRNDVTELENKHVDLNTRVDQVETDLYETINNVDDRVNEVEAALTAHESEVKKTHLIPIVGMVLHVNDAYTHGLSGIVYAADTHVLYEVDAENHTARRLEDIASGVLRQGQKLYAFVKGEPLTEYALSTEVAEQEQRLSAQERQMYYQMWLAVRGKAAAIVKVRAGGKVTYSLSGNGNDLQVKYANREKDTFITIEDPGRTTFRASDKLFGRPSGSALNGYDTNDEDIIELAALDIHSGYGSAFRGTCLLPCPNIYYQEWDMSNVGAIQQLWSFSGMTGTLDLRNMDWRKLVYCGEWNYFCSPFPQHASRILLPLGFMTEYWPVIAQNMFSCQSFSGNTMDITDPSQVEPNIEDWDMSGMKSFDRLFNFSVFSRLDLSRWDTGKATNMQGMFNACYKLEYLDISGFDTGALNVANGAQLTGNGNPLKWIEVGPALFKTALPLQLVGPTLGINDDGTDNGWLAHVLSVLPTIRNKEGYTELLEQEDGVWYLNDGQSRTIYLNANLKNKEWAQELLAEMQAKGFTIA